MYNLEEKYRIPKNRVVTLINAIVDNPTLEKLMKALNVSRSAVGNYLATLTNIGITKGVYTPKILLSDDVILKEYRG